MKLQFTYKLTGAGWALVHLRDNDKELSMTASYLHDSLSELVEGINKILSKKASTIDVYFMDEPGEHKMTITAINEEELALKVQWSYDWVSWGMVKEETYNLVFETITSQKHFGGLILSVLENLCIEFGEEGYVENWGRHPFPANEFGRLRKLYNTLAT